MPVFAVATGNAAMPPVNSGRLIVKFRANQLPLGLSVSQINGELRRPLSEQVVGELQASTGMNIAESHAISNGAHVMILPDANSTTVAQAIAAIAQMPNVEYVEEDIVMTPQAVPNDVNYTFLWGLKPVSSTPGAAPGMTGSYGADFQTAWNTTTGTGVVVAVVDTGITAHPDIVGLGGAVAAGTGSNLVSSGYNFITDCRRRGTCPVTYTTASSVVAASPDASDTGDFISTADSTTLGSFFYGRTVSSSSWHGTHVTGTIAALGNNSIGVIGGAYSAKVLPVRVMGKGGGSMSDIMEGVMWAAGVHPTIPNPNPAKVINLSLGGGGGCTITEQNGIDAVVAAGAVVVVAAGNSNADVAGFNPANCNNVITVASIGKDGSRAYYSNFSSPATNLTPKYVTLAAPGGDMWLTGFDSGIYSSLNSGATTPLASSYANYQGTSMATPHVTAAVALMMARNQALTPEQIMTILASSASLTAFPAFSPSATALLRKAYPTFDCAARNNCGAGILNARLAVQNSIQPLSPGVTTLNFGAVTSILGNNSVVTLTNNSQASVKLGATTVTGSNPGFFTPLIDTCKDVTIAPSGTCQITVSYAPTLGGVHSATLTTPTTATGVATTVGLAGTAGATLTPAASSGTASPLDTESSTTLNVAFSNGNPWAVRTGALSFSHPGIMAASRDNCSNFTLAPGASCSATITVSPKDVGAYAGTVSLSPSAGGTPAITTISGKASVPTVLTGNFNNGGGGCSIMPYGVTPDMSLLLAMFAVAVYWLRRRISRARGEA